MPEETTTIFCMEGKKHKKRILSILMALWCALLLCSSGAAVPAVGLRRRSAR